MQLIWEYMILDMETAKDASDLVIVLNFHGINSWELVSVRPHPQDAAKSRLFFKRVKKESEQVFIDG